LTPFSFSEEPLRTYRWSTYPAYLKRPGLRPPWLRVERVLGEMGIPKDSVKMWVTPKVVMLGSVVLRLSDLLDEFLLSRCGCVGDEKCGCGVCDNQPLLQVQIPERCGNVAAVEGIPG